MAKHPDTRKAVHAFKEFSGHTPKRVRVSRLEDHPVTGWEMGPVVGIAYEAKRDGETERYFHEFKKSARPRLVSRDDGKQLYLDGGRYKVTDRGIEDMPQLFVVNPSPRKHRGGSTKRRKVAPMATRRRRRRATTRRRGVALFSRNPIRRRRTRRRVAYARNPIRRRRRRSVAMYRNPAPRRRRRSHSMRRYRRNPSVRREAVNFGKLIIPAAGIGLGAVGAEIIMGYLPIPANFKTGVMRHVTKGAVGIAAGMLIGKVLRQKRLGNYIALGAVVIAVHDGVKEFIANSMPSVHMGQYVPRFRGSLGGMGYTNPAAVARLGQYVAPIQSSLYGAARPGMMPDQVAVKAGGGGETSFAV